MITLLSELRCPRQSRRGGSGPRRGAIHGTPLAASPSVQDGLLTQMASDYHGRRLGDIVVVRLTHKFAQMIDGVDLSQYSVGDTAAFRADEARLLIAEGWAEAIADRRNIHRPPDQSAAVERLDVSPQNAGQLIRHGARSRTRTARTAKTSNK